MRDEELLEYGIVKSSAEGIAVVTLQDNENCSECTAKIFCKADDSKGRELVVKDTFGLRTGTRVLISVSGNQVLNASFLLYGIPLILIVASIIAGSFIFKSNIELYSTLSGVGLAGLYYLIFSKTEKKKDRIIPKIVYQQELN